jgi:hypothetical protein
VREITVFLHSHVVGTARAVGIYKTYGADAIQVMPDNLYRLARDIRGIGFRTADAIAMKLGIEKTAMIRERAGISYALTEAMDEGHCGLSFALRNAFDLWSMQAVDLPAPLVLSLLQYPVGEVKRLAKDLLQIVLARDLAGDVADGAAEVSPESAKRSVGQFELFGIGVALVPDLGELANPTSSVRRRQCQRSTQERPPQETQLSRRTSKRCHQRHSHRRRRQLPPPPPLLAEASILPDCHPDPARQSSALNRPRISGASNAKAEP